MSPPRTAEVWVGAPLQAGRGAQVCGKGSVSTRVTDSMAQFADEVEFEVLLVCLSPAPKLPNTQAEVTKSSRELVELREGPCSTTVLVRSGWWSSRKGLLQDHHEGMGEGGLPCGDRRLGSASLWSGLVHLLELCGERRAHCYPYLASSLAVFLCTFCAADGFLLFFFNRYYYYLRVLCT